MPCDCAIDTAAAPVRARSHVLVRILVKAVGGGTSLGLGGDGDQRKSIGKPINKRKIMHLGGGRGCTATVAATRHHSIYN